MGDYQARFCERFRGETPLYLLDLLYLIFFLYTCRQENVNRLTESVINLVACIP